jgi:integrase
MHRLWERAMLWDVLPVQRNIMELVEIKGSTRRRKKPDVRTPEECMRILHTLQQPYRTMALVSLSLGLRVSETLALRWSDFEFKQMTVTVNRAVVRGIVDRVKTEYSADELPIDSGFAAELLAWKNECPPSADGWVFPSPVTNRPYESGTIQQKVFRKTAEKLGFAKFGWHTFRHTYRAWLDAAGAPIGVQQKLMRHAQVSTTMNIYGDALMDAKREANSNALRVLKGHVANAEESKLVYFGVNASSELATNASKSLIAS